MKASTKSTLAATLIATAAGVGAWFFGLSKAIWPAHPQIAAFVITIVVSIVVNRSGPSMSARREFNQCQRCVRRRGRSGRVE